MVNYLKNCFGETFRLTHQVSLTSFRCCSNYQGKLLNLLCQIKMPAKELALELTHQVSNLDSSEPKSDVLPITPWVKIIECKIRIIFVIFLLVDNFDNTFRSKLVFMFSYD